MAALLLIFLEKHFVLLRRGLLRRIRIRRCEEILIDFFAGSAGEKILLAERVCRKARERSASRKNNGPEIFRAVIFIIPDQGCR